MITLKSIGDRLNYKEMDLNVEYCVALDEYNTDAMTRIEDDLGHIYDLWAYYEPLMATPTPEGQRGDRAVT